MAPVQEDTHSLLHIERVSQFVSLSPASLANPLPALCASIFSPLLLSYFPPARGVVLAYEDVSLSSSPPVSSSSFSPPSSSSKKSNSEPLLLRHVDEYSAPFLWATANFLIWRPRCNARITARITHQSQTHITLSHLNTFPVSILKEHLPADWTWQQSTSSANKHTSPSSSESGSWIDANAQPLQNGAEIEVRIRDFDGRLDAKGRGKGFLKIDASLLSEDEEAALQTEAAKRASKGKGKAPRAQGVLKRSSQVAMDLQ